MGALISFYLYGGFFSNEEKLVGHFALPISIAVSYTHLDVYKRQAKARPDAGSVKAPSL